MSLWVVVGVGVGAGLGAQLRYLAELVHARSRLRRGLGRATFPWATLTVNVVGSALLGSVAALVQRGDLAAAWGTVLGAGLAGGLTTFSTFSLDVVALRREHRTLRAAVDVVAHLVLGVGAAVLGFHLLR